MESKSKFKKGDRVRAEGFVGVLIIDKPDDYLTFMTDKLYWETLEEDYVLGKLKTSNSDSYPENELTLAD